MKTKIVSCVVFCLLFAVCADAELATDIMDATGVKGGLVVHIGCGDGSLTAELRVNDSYLVHGVDFDAENVEKARKYIKRLGIYGDVSVELLRDRVLPYIDNSVNLVVYENPRVISFDEVLRVLVPGGVAYVKVDGKWKKSVKPRPDEIDEWTHFMHGPDGNAVANDSIVDFPYHIQWVGSPTHAKSHSHLSTINVMVSSGGRLFYIADEAAIALPNSLPSRWALFARDAFNGVTLWRRPLASWQASALHDRNRFPVDLFRRLVADGDKVYATLSIFGPVSELDGATGETIQTYAGTENTDEIILDGGVLYLVINTTHPDKVSRRELADKRSKVEQKRIVAINAETGKLLWEKKGKDTLGVMPMTLASKDGRIFFSNTENVICVDSKSGKEHWRFAMPASYDRPSWAAPTLVAYDDLVLIADRGTRPSDPTIPNSKGGVQSPADLFVLSAETGEKLWGIECGEGCRAPVDIFAVDGLVWVGENMGRHEQDFRNARDVRTGEIKKTFPISEDWVNHHHHRCYRDKATENFILAGRTGVEFIDLQSGEVTLHQWIRGICKYGILPCNGLIYLPPDQCGCYLDSMLKGFNAVAPKRVTRPAPRLSMKPRLEKGPAYNPIGVAESDSGHDGDWPTFRASPARDGYTKSSVPNDLAKAWETNLGGKLTQPVAADGKVFVASIEDHTVHALDANSGKTAWTYTAGGRIDSPPTIAGGLAVFGSRDGWVYALRASDGELVWRYRAAPEEQKLMARGQLESVWPVHGSVMVQDGIVYFAAGRSAYFDGGIYMHKLDLMSGQTILGKRFSGRDKKTGKAVNLFDPFEGELMQDREMPGVQPDILSTDGKNIWMRSVTFNCDLEIQQDFPSHLFGSMGYLDDSWWERGYWIYGPHMYGGAAGVHYAKNVSPAARIMVYDDESVYGYQEETFASVGIFASTKVPTLKEKSSAKSNKSKFRNARNTEVVPDWQNDVPLYVNGIALAGDTLFIAGPPKFDEESTRAFLSTNDTDDYELNPILRDAVDTFDGKKGMLLWAVNKKTGTKMAEYKLDDAPVFDGLIAANNSLYISTKSGAVLCMAKK